MDKTSAITIKDIALYCGISVSTASKAINGYADVSTSTVENVKRAVKELGYHPNSIARGLRTKRMKNIGVLFYDDLGSGLKHEYFSNILDSFINVCGYKGYSVTYLVPTQFGSNQTYMDQCISRGFDGVAVLCAPYSDFQVSRLIDGPIPVVTVDRVFDNCVSVSSDNFGGMKCLMDEIISLGHRKIAYIHGEKTAVTKKRLASFYRALNDAEIPLNEDWILEARYRDISLCKGYTEKLLSKNDRPTCILFPDDYSLIGGLNEIQSRGLKVPDDISVAGYDGSYYVSLTKPRITTIKQDTLSIGSITAKKLIECIESPETSFPEHIVVPATLQKGESVAAFAGNLRNVV